MRNLKKIIIALFLCLIFIANVSALSVDQITPDKEFIIYSADPESVAKALKTDTESLDKKVKEQNIIYLAVNKKNTKQIQLTSNETEFSKTVGNLSDLSDTSIKSLIPDITGKDNIKGKIVIKESQKYVNINLLSEDDGYILTQYFTVRDKKLYTLSFYTDKNVSTDYIETAFTTTTETNDGVQNINSVPKSFKIAVICGTIIFGLAFIAVLISIILDIIKSKKRD